MEQRRPCQLAHAHGAGPTLALAPLVQQCPPCRMEQRRPCQLAHAHGAGPTLALAPLVQQCPPCRMEQRRPCQLAHAHGAGPTLALAPLVQQRPACRAEQRRLCQLAHGHGAGQTLALAPLVQQCPPCRMEQRRPCQLAHAHGAGPTLVLYFYFFALRFPGHLSLPTDRERSAATILACSLAYNELLFLSVIYVTQQKLPGESGTAAGSDSVTGDDAWAGTLVGEAAALDVIVTGDLGRRFYFTTSTAGSATVGRARASVAEG